MSGPVYAVDRIEGRLAVLEGPDGRLEVVSWRGCPMGSGKGTACALWMASGARTRRRPPAAEAAAPGALPPLFSRRKTGREKNTP